MSPGENLTGLLRRLVKVYYNLFAAVCLFPYEAVLMNSLINRDMRITSSAKSVSVVVYSSLVFVWKGENCVLQQTSSENCFSELL